MIIELIFVSEGEVECWICFVEGIYLVICIGIYVWLYLLDVVFDLLLFCVCLVDYDLCLIVDGWEFVGIVEWVLYLFYFGCQCVSLVFKLCFDQLFYGFCCKLYYLVVDSLLQVDWLLEENLLQVESCLVLLMMSGDQVYVDDVVGLMLVVIYGLICCFGLYGEYLEGVLVDDSEVFYVYLVIYYWCEDLLFVFKFNEVLCECFFGGVKKLIFILVNVYNYLVGLVEVLVMYLLVWLLVFWCLVRLELLLGLDVWYVQCFVDECWYIEVFCDGLFGVVWVLVYILLLMIFDDYDIIDDWNFFVCWELIVYGYLFFWWIIGNVLFVYLFCQGWGNDLQYCGEWLVLVMVLMEGVVVDGWLFCVEQDCLFDVLFDFQYWYYWLFGSLILIVFDMCICCWCSECNLGWFFGLMDWEVLSEFQQDLFGEKVVIIVLLVLMFGVKLIEGVQKFFSWIGQLLLVDVENWMVYCGVVLVMMNIFCYLCMLGNYLIFFGDVYYFFVYDIWICYCECGFWFWQIISSGIKNEFL